MKLAYDYRHGLVLASIALAALGFGCAPGSPLDPGGNPDTGHGTPIASVIPVGSYSGGGQLNSTLLSGAESETLRTFSRASDSISMLAAFGASGEILTPTGEAMAVGYQKSLTFLLQDPEDGTKLIGEPVTLTVTSITPTTTGLIINYSATMNTLPPQGGGQVTISGTQASETYILQQSGEIMVLIQILMGAPADQPRLTAILSGQVILAK
ncbi:MAG: hypothetical protein KA354_05005 [Phycisphaerae bacterium]|nr:hypothetical protein [Phycisphaerae bacterium]